jgi:site-specific recombinase XerD
MAAGRANLEESLPKPWVETAIEEGNGSADFLEKDLVEALKDLKDADLQAQFTAADQRAVAEVRGFVKFLKDEKLPKATSPFCAWAGTTSPKCCAKGS